MGESYQAFNALMQQFLDALSQTFPEEESLTDFRNKFPLFCSMQPKEPHRLFMQSTIPHAQRLGAHDETVITDGSLGDLEGLVDVGKLWTAEGVTESIHDTIWRYLDTLQMLGTSISSIPPDMMNKIESIAASISNEVEGGAPMPDMFSMIARIQQDVDGLGQQG